MLRAVRTLSTSFTPNRAVERCRSVVRPARRRHWWA